jgi:hypothetical protein
MNRPQINHHSTRQVIYIGVKLGFIEIVDIESRCMLEDIERNLHLLSLLERIAF